MSAVVNWKPGLPIRPLVRPRCTSSAPLRFLPGGAAPSCSDWQSSFAILSRKSPDSSSSSSPPSVNGHASSPASSPCSSLNPVASIPSPPPANLPRPLTITDLSPTPTHGSTLRVAYQGVPGAYSEAAAGKAYTKCDAIPCYAFQAVELWIADRTVLPVENSFGGSIQRN